MASVAPDKTRIVDAFKYLIEIKGFDAITMGQIAQEIGVTEDSICYHFKNVNDLLHLTLKEFLLGVKQRFSGDLIGISGALNKLRKLIWVHIHTYASSPVLAKMLLIEARSCRDYYTSDTYHLVKEYSDMIIDIVEEGVDLGEIRDDIPSSLIRQGILGCIENTCLTHILFDREFDADELTDDICELLFSGITSKTG